MSSNVIRYGPRPPEAQVDHEIDATKAPIATEAVTVIYLTEPDIVAAVLPKPLQPADEPLVRIQLQRVRIEGMAPFGSAVFSVTARHGDRYGDYPLFMPSPPNSPSPAAAKHSASQRNSRRSRWSATATASPPAWTGWATG